MGLREAANVVGENSASGKVGTGGEVRLYLQAGPARSFASIVQSENAEAFIQPLLLRMSRWQQQSTKPSSSPPKGPVWWPSSQGCGASSHQRRPHHPQGRQCNSKGVGPWMGDLGSGLDTDACQVSGLINDMFSLSGPPVKWEGPKEVVLSPVCGT